MHATSSFYILIMLFLVVLFMSLQPCICFANQKEFMFMQPTFKLKIENCFCILLNVIREHVLNFFSVLKFESTIHV